jgi:hypothetical protein
MQDPNGFHALSLDKLLQLLPIGAFLAFDEHRVKVLIEFILRNISPRETKVCYFEHPVLCDEDVSGRQVAVNALLGREEGHPLGDLK